MSTQIAQLTHIFPAFMRIPTPQWWRFRNGRRSRSQGAACRQHCGPSNFGLCRCRLKRTYSTVFRVSGIEPCAREAYAASRADGWRDAVFAATGDALWTAGSSPTLSRQKREFRPMPSTSTPSICDFLERPRHGQPRTLSPSPCRHERARTGGCAQMIRAAHRPDACRASLGHARPARPGITGRSCRRTALCRAGVARRVFWRRFFEASMSPRQCPHNEIFRAGPRAPPPRAARAMSVHGPCSAGQVRGPGAEDLLDAPGPAGDDEADCVLSMSALGARCRCWRSAAADCRCGIFSRQARRLPFQEPGASYQRGCWCASGPRGQARGPLNRRSAGCSAAPAR